MGTETHKIVALLPGREEISLQVETDDQGAALKVSLAGVGGPDTLELIEDWRKTLKVGEAVDAWPLPEGNSPSEILLREVLLKLKKQWIYPYEEEELCHCRCIPTVQVDMAIVCGAHTPEEVSLETSASTACGTCRTDVEALIAFRIQKKA